MSAPEKFHKKPVEIEAYGPLDIDNMIRAAVWCDGIAVNAGMPKGYVIIATLEGDMVASLGDWIIRGVAGEFYPCKPDIFEQTYERVAAPSGEQ